MSDGKSKQDKMAAKKGDISVDVKKQASEPEEKKPLSFQDKFYGVLKQIKIVRTFFSSS